MRNTWSREGIDILVRDYPHSSTEELSAILNKPASSIVWKANYLGLRKTPEYLQRIRAIAGSKKGRQHAHL